MDERQSSTYASEALLHGAVEFLVSDVTIKRETDM